MSNSQKISAMAPAATPLTGAELVPIVQNGLNVRVASGLIGAINNLQYQGTWNATTNSPAITSSVGTVGYYYIVNTAGTTTINGISSWAVGDWIIFSNTGVWQKIGGGTLSSIQIQNDATGNTDYNLTMTTATSGLINTAVVDSTALTFNPSTNKLDCAGQVEAANFGIPGCANYVLYWGSAANRVTLANYNAGGIIHFEVNGGAATLILNADGTYQFVNLYSTTVSSSPRAVYVDSNGIIGYVSSVKESKTNIEPIANADWVSDLKPVSFNRRKKNEDGSYSEEAYSDKVYGLIAEDVETVYPDLCMYDGDKLVGINYDQLVIPLLKKVQELEARLAQLEAK